MPSRNEAQPGRIGHRKDRRHSSTERVNTARADNEHCNVALHQINAVDDIPALDAIGFSATDSPTLRRLQHPAYELSERPAVNQSHISPFQRPKSSVSLPKDEDFAFGARQDRQTNVRIGRQQQIRPNSPTEKSSQRTQSAEKANETPDVVPPKEKHSTLPVAPSNPAETIPKNSATTIRMDLTCESPSAALPTIKPTNTIENAQSHQEKICQELLVNIKHGPPSDSLARNGLDEAALCNTHPLSMEAQPRSPLNIMPIEHKGNAPSEKYSQNVHHPVQAINVPLLFSEAASPPVACGQTNLLPPTAGQTDVSKKETQSCSTLSIDLPATPTLPPGARHHLLNVSQQPTVREVNPTSIDRIQLAVSKEGKSVSSLTEEALGSDASHTLRTNARRAVEKPMRVCKVVTTPQRALQPATLVGQQVTELPHVTAASNGPIAPSRDTLPSEEDLFYLLMHRQRQRKDAQTSVMVRQKQLETANARLAKQNENFQRQLSVACASRDQSAAEASLQKVAMEDFKARFQKLKGFVNGLINDYGALRRQADQMKNSQQSLMNEKEHLYRELRGFQIASAASERTMSNIVSTVAKVRQSMGPLEQSLVDSKKTLESESRLLSKEREKNKRLETYLLQVATTQSRCSFAIQNDQRAILDQLRDITSMIHIVENAVTAEPQPLQLPGLDECVRMLTELHDADRVVPADITQVTDAVRTLSQSLSSHRKSLDESIQAAGDDQIKLSNQLVTQITTLLESFCATSVEKEQFNNLREDKVRLEEQLKCSENVVQEIRDSRTSADTRESHLRNITDSLLNELKTLRNQPLVDHKHRSQVDERDMISTWQMKYTTISQKLTDSEECLNRREKEIRQGEEDVEKLSRQLERVQAERDIAVQALNRELNAAKDNFQHLKSAQDANDRKDEEIASLKQRLEATESILNDAQAVKEESQRKEIELLALKDMLAKIEETSQQLLQTLAERPSQTHGASQRMIAIQDGLTIEDRNFLAGLAGTGVSSRDPAHQLRRQANWNDGLAHTQALQTAIAEIVHIDSKGRQSLMSGQIFDTTESSHPAPTVDPEILQTQETTFVPESQPVADSPYEGFPIDAPYFGSMSSPLANISPFIESSDEVHNQSVYFGPEKVLDGSASTSTQAPANFRPSPRLSVSSQKDLPSSRSPSSSYGDAMLLEAEEELRNLGQYGATVVQENSVQRSGPRSGSTSPGRPLSGKSGGTSRSRIQKPSSKTAKTKSKCNPSVSPKHPSPRRLRSGSQIRSKTIMPLGERASSDQNILVSPLRGMLRDKHLPNSAAKRRLEDEEMSIPSSSHHDSKRLKHNLSALEVKTPTNQKGSSFLDQVTLATGRGRLNHLSMPTGGRKGSIVRTNAPAPCTGQHMNKKPRKNSKTDRYSVQFGKETT